MPIIGLNELQEKLNTLADTELRRIERQALNEVSEKVKTDMKGAAPVSTERNIHGRDAIDIGDVEVSSKGMSVQVGMSQILSGHGADYWNWVRG